MARLLTVAEVAEILRVSHYTVYRMIRRGRITTIDRELVEGRILIEESALESRIHGQAKAEPVPA